MTVASDRAVVQFVLPAARAIMAPFQTERMAEDRRGVPAVAGPDGGVAVAAQHQDLKVDVGAAGVDQPVFGNAGAAVADAQVARVLADGTVG